MSNRPSQLLFGGSFDPIHCGHLICARFVAERTGASAVRLIPARQSPHKTVGADLAESADRLTMLQLAVQGSPLFSVDPCELHRPPPSYSYDTASRIRSQLFADTELLWLVGSDHLPRLHTWHRFDELLGVVRFVVMRRAGAQVDPAGLDPRVRPLLDSMIDTPAIDISSTEVRRRARQGLPIDYLVPAAVARYIETRGVYRA